MKQIFCVVLVVVLCFSLGGCATRGSGTTVVEIATDSMAPTFSAGDRILCEAVDPAELEVGDIITYWTILDGNRVMVTHRIHQIYADGDTLFFSTIGDNNSMVDPMTVRESDIIGRYVRKLILGIF